ATTLAPLFKSLGNMSDITANSASTFIILLFLTSFQMVLAELVPKAIAMQYPTQAALYTVFPMQFSLYLFSWSIYVLNASTNVILKIFGMPITSHKHIHSPEEIDLIISESFSGGIIEHDEHSRLHYALQLKVRTAKQIIVPRIHLFAVDASTPIDEFLNIASKSPYNHIPIYADVIDNIIGIVHIKEMVKYYVEKGKIESIHDVIRSVLLIPEIVTADKILELFREENSEQAIVIDEFGGTVGMVTLEDVLAEFMGEVGDEFKKDIAKVEKLDNGKLRMPGLTRIDEVEFITGLKIEARSDTIGGFVTELLGRLPDIGDIVNTDELEILVEKVTNRVVNSVIVYKKDKIRYEIDNE
ncbi:MAG: HlyC/CorC family transporter, partial [Candidatus Sericytochromatia bacterium]|nr:HlyC/CorC family transporter [Candidatus Sericytochromatia bacterium]